MVLCESAIQQFLGYLLCTRRRLRLRSSFLFFLNSILLSSALAIGHARSTYERGGYIIHNHRRGIGVIEEKEYGVLKSSDGAVDIRQHKDGIKENNRNRGITKRSATNLPTKEGLVAGVEDGGGHVHLSVGRLPATWIRRGRSRALRLASCPHVLI